MYTRYEPILKIYGIAKASLTGKLIDEMGAFSDDVLKLLHVFGGKSRYVRPFVGGRLQ